MRRLHTFRWLLVGGIALLLALTLASQYVHRVHLMRVADTHIVMRDVAEAIFQYGMSRTPRCPRSLQTLVDEGYIARLPRDGWRQPLVYVCPGSHPPDDADLISAGADGKLGTADDLDSWDPGVIIR